MRYLTIVRHAKAEPANVGENDVDRVLSTRGRHQASKLREWVKDPEELGHYGPVTALVSAAARTRETYSVAFAGTAFVHAVETSELIYNGRRDVSAEDLLAHLAAIDPVTESLLVVGHNPTVFELATMLASSPIKILSKGKYPLGAAIVLEIDETALIGPGPYRLVTTFVPEV